MRNRGFTLVEMLIVIGILTIFGVLILTIFTRTLKGSNKSQILGLIKQNGQLVLEVLDKTTRGADKVLCPKDSTPSKTLVVVKNGSYTRFRFIDPNTNNPSLGTCNSINGCLIEDFPVQPSSGSETDLKVFLDNLCTNPPVSSQVLTDTNTQKGVSIQSGTFTKNPSAGFRDVISVSFQIAPGLGAPPAVTGQVDAATFQTTIQLR